MDIHKFQGGSNPRGRPKGRGISSYIRDLLEEQDPKSGQPKNKLIAKLLIDIALDPETNKRDALLVAGMIMDRLEGKPVATNINAEIASNPFENVPTEQIESLKKRLEEIKGTKNAM